MSEVEPAELINLIATIAVVIVLFQLVRSKVSLFPSLFVWGVFFVMLGNIFTVLETFLWPTLFNHSEHLVFSLGTICFCAGSFKILLRNGR